MLNAYFTNQAFLALKFIWTAKKVPISDDLISPSTLILNIIFIVYPSLQKGLDSLFFVFCLFVQK